MSRDLRDKEPLASYRSPPLETKTRPIYSRTRSAGDEPRTILPPDGEAEKSPSRNRDYRNERRSRQAYPIEHHRSTATDPFLHPTHRMKAFDDQGSTSIFASRRPQYLLEGRQLSVAPQPRPGEPRRDSSPANASVSSSSGSRGSSSSSPCRGTHSRFLEEAERELDIRLKERKRMSLHRQELDNGHDWQRRTTSLEDELSALKPYLEDDLPALKNDELEAIKRIENQQEFLKSSAQRSLDEIQTEALRCDLAELDALRRKCFKEMNPWEGHERSQSKDRIRKLQTELELRGGQTFPIEPASDSNETDRVTILNAERPPEKLARNANVPDILVSAPHHQAPRSDSGMGAQRIETGARDLYQRNRSRSTSDIHSEVSTTPSLNSSVFESWVRIAGGQNTESDSIKARAVSDTGCRDNWISLDVLKRARMEDQLQDVKFPRHCEGFGGRVEARTKVELTISATNSSYSRRVWFYVLDDPPFDMVLGQKFIYEHGFAFSNFALILRKPKYSEKEKQEMEESRRKRDEENRRLEQQRRAEQAAERARARETAAQRSSAG